MGKYFYICTKTVLCLTVFSKLFLDKGALNEDDNVT